MYISWSVISWLSVALIVIGAISGMSESVERAKMAEREGQNYWEMPEVVERAERAEREARSNGGND